MEDGPPPYPPPPTTMTTNTVITGIRVIRSGNHFYISPIYAIPTPNSLSFIFVLTLKFFNIVLPYL